jgi:hypothetical protein
LTLEALPPSLERKTSQRQAPQGGRFPRHLNSSVTVCLRTERIILHPVKADGASELKR